MQSAQTVAQNGQFTKYLDDHNIEHILAQKGDHRKQGKVERFIKTIRGRIEKYFTAKNTVVWHDSLQKIVSQYNKSFHSSIGKPPSKVTKADAEEIRNNDMKKASEIYRTKIDDIKEGDTVRAVKSKSLFEKGGTPSFQKNLFVVKKKHAGTFKLENKDGGNILKQDYRRYQLRKIKTVDVDKPDDKPEVIKKGVEVRKKVIQDKRVDRKMNKEGIKKIPIILTAKTRKQQKKQDEHDAAIAAMDSLNT